MRLPRAQLYFAPRRDRRGVTTWTTAPCESVHVGPEPYTIVGQLSSPWIVKGQMTIDRITLRRPIRELCSGRRKDFALVVRWPRRVAVATKRKKLDVEFGKAATSRIDFAGIWTGLEPVDPGDRAQRIDVLFTIRVLGECTLS